MADRLLEQDVQLVVLGEGHPKYHALLEDLERRHAGKFWAYLGFADDLAHQIEAGADIFLMPSLFEPCGLNQLYSLAHGTVPLVRATGGLADTVVDANPETLADGTANGFRVHRADAAGPLGDDRTSAGPLARPRRLAEAERTGMTADWSWERSAREYVRLYQEIRPNGSGPRASSADPGESSSRPPRQERNGLSLARDVPSISPEATYPSSEGLIAVT